MKAHALRFFPLVFLAGMLLWCFWPGGFVVSFPRLGKPAVLRPGDQLRIEITHSNPFAAPAWTLSVRAESGEQLDLRIKSQSHSRSRHSLLARLPETAHPEAYTLIVQTGAHEAVLPKAVHVVEEFSANVTFVQVADLPTFGDDESGDAAMDRIVDEINVIHPDFVLVTGDVAYGDAEWDRYRRLYRALLRFDAPVVITTGNHEYYGLAGYLQHYGHPTHIASIGEHRVLSLNTAHGRDQLTYSQFEWAARRMKEHTGQPMIVQMHHPMFESRKTEGLREEFIALCVEHKIPIVLAGHWHADRVFGADGTDERDPNASGTKFVVTTAAGAPLYEKHWRSKSHHGYRVVRMNGNRVVSFTYDFDEDGARDPEASHPLGKLRWEQKDSETIVHNDFNEDLPGACVRVRVANTEKTLLHPNRGKIQFLRPGDDGGVIYGIRVDLPARSKTVIRMERR